MDQQGVSWHRRLLYTSTNWILFVAGCINLGVGTCYALQGDPAVAATSLTAGLVLLFAGTIDRFESIKGLGLEAKTRALDQKLHEADEALGRLQALTELSGAALVDLNSKVGRWAEAPSAREANVLAQHVKRTMQESGSSREAIAKALEPGAKVLCHDLAHSLLLPVHRALQERSTELNRQRAVIRQPIIASDPEWLRLSAELRAVNSHIKLINAIHAIPFVEYPDRMLALFDDVPGVAETLVRTAKEKATGFAAEIVHLQRAMELRNPELWFAELDDGTEFPEGADRS